MSGRRGGTYADMVRSLAVVGALSIVVLLMGASRQLIFPSEDNARAVRTVSYARETAAAKRLPPADALVPANLPARWRATSVRFDPSPVALHVGFVTPREAYAAVEETTGDAAPFLDDLGIGAAASRSEQIGGTSWESRRTEKGEVALVTTHRRATVVVTGNASLAELRVLAGSLR